MSNPKPLYTVSLTILRCSAIATLGLASASAVTVTTSDSGQIAAFKAGKTVQTFDALTAQSISEYNAVPATSTIFNDSTQPNVWYNSGGGNFFNPSATDPTTATPIGIFNPSGVIAGDKLSANNVAGPLEINTTNAFGPGAFLEVLFTTAVQSIGFYVSHITPGQTLTLFLKDAGAGNITGADSGGSLVAGQFIGITRASADVLGLSLISSDGKFTIDDLTYAASATGGGGGGTGVPESGYTLGLLCGAVVLLVFAQRSLQSKTA